MFPGFTKTCQRTLVPVMGLVLCACTAVGPDYVEPELSVPDAWHMRIVHQVQQGPEATLQTWWTVFDDPTLNALIDRARLGNLNLQTAASRVNAARASLAITRGERLPAVDGTGQTSRTRQSDDGWLAQVAPNNGFDAQNLYEIGWMPAGRLTFSVVFAGPLTRPRHNTKVLWKPSGM